MFWRLFHARAIDNVADRNETGLRRITIAKPQRPRRRRGPRESEQPGQVNCRFFTKGGTTSCCDSTRWAALLACVLLAHFFVARPGGRDAVRAEMGVARQASLPGVVLRRQVRHLHPLGRLLGAGVGQDAASMPSGIGTTSHDKKPDNVWWQFHKKNYGESFDYKDFAPKFRAELFDAGQVGRYLRPLRRTVHRADLEAPRGLLPLAQRRGEPRLGPALECRRDRAAPRPDGRTRRRRRASAA